MNHTEHLLLGVGPLGRILCIGSDLIETNAMPQNLVPLSVEDTTRPQWRVFIYA